MKIAIAFAMFGAVSASSKMQLKFESFVKKYGKQYKSTQEKYEKFGNFVENMLESEKYALQNPKATFGVSPISDMSAEEYSNWNSLRVTPEALKEHSDRIEERVVNPVTLPTSFDWRQKGAVAPIKNQGQCGSCWSFGTVASIEGNNFVANGKLVSLSEEELVQCDTTDMGCNGGLPSNAYKWMLKNKQGLETESDYKYTSGTGNTGTCSKDEKKETVFLNTWKSISTNEDTIASELMKYGPLAVAIVATGPVQQYTGGIISGSCGGQIDHAVTLVGFGEENGTKFWIVKNSWGESWGEKGYFRMERGVNQCLVATMVTAAEVRNSEADAIFV